jgi:hypothetical protein
VECRRDVEIGLSGRHAVRIETDAAVTLVGVDVHDSGKHPTTPTADQAGIFAVRASHADGLRIQGNGGRVHDNSGHGVVLGHPTEQTGAVYGFVGDLQIFGNQIGIRVQQKDDVAAPTASTILSNNVYDNAQAGIYISRSSQRYTATADRRAFSSNDVHHNGVTGGCTPETGDEVASQVVFDGPIVGTDPTVSNLDPNPGPDQAEFPDDYRCYWGADDSVRTQTLAECNDLNNPGRPSRVRRHRQPLPLERDAVPPRVGRRRHRGARPL